MPTSYRLQVFGFDGAPLAGAEVLAPLDFIGHPPELAHPADALGIVTVTYPDDADLSVLHPILVYYPHFGADPSTVCVQDVRIDLTAAQPITVPTACQSATPVSLPAWSMLVSLVLVLALAVRALRRSAAEE